jgi:pimeloyl-ACP methyl ester carboxylesterase
VNNDGSGFRSRAGTPIAEQRCGSFPLESVLHLSGKTTTVRDPVRFLCTLTIFVMVAVSGCQTPRIRQVPLRAHGLPRAGLASLGPQPLITLHPSLSSTANAPGPLTPEEAYARLRIEVEGQGGTAPEQWLVLADLADRIGRRVLMREPVAALLWFRETAAFTAFYLANPGIVRGASAVSAQDQRAIALHNHAVEELLRCAGTGTEETDPAWREQLAAMGMEVLSTTPERGPIVFDELWIASDYHVAHLAPVGQVGLGVPLIAMKTLEGRQAVPGRFLPPVLRLPATAVFRPRGPIEEGRWRAQPAILTLHDPLDEPRVNLGPGVPDLPLAADLTTPLAHQFLRSPQRAMATGGLFEPDQFTDLGGIYFGAPYRPGKIPVLFIHGLWSTPDCWMTMVNRLQADPILRSRYQFWYAYYPSGFPVLIAAAMLRQSLHEIRAAIDPDRTDRALDQMVVVGHSLGGVLTRQFVQSSGPDFERVLFTRPSEQIAMTPETRQALARILSFTPEPSVRRVVFIATPHRGSNVANQVIGEVGALLIRRPEQIVSIYSELLALNGPSAFQPTYRERPPGILDNLVPDSPFVKGLARLPIAADVPCHSIIPVLFPGTLPSWWTDGLVTFNSSHLEGAASEVVFRNDHMAFDAAEAIAEVRRILRLHIGLNDEGAGIRLVRDTVESEERRSRVLSGTGGMAGSNRRGEE